MEAQADEAALRSFTGGVVRGSGATDILLGDRLLSLGLPGLHVGSEAALDAVMQDGDSTVRSTADVHIPQALEAALLPRSKESFVTLPKRMFSAFAGVASAGVELHGDVADARLVAAALVLACDATIEDRCALLFRLVAPVHSQWLGADHVKDMLCLVLGAARVLGLSSHSPDNERGGALASTVESAFRTSGKVFVPSVQPGGAGGEEAAVDTASSGRDMSAGRHAALKAKGRYLLKRVAQLDGETLGADASTIPGSSRSGEPVTGEETTISNAFVSTALQEKQIGTVLASQHAAPAPPKGYIAVPYLGVRPRSSPMAPPGASLSAMLWGSGEHAQKPHLSVQGLIQWCHTSRPVRTFLRSVESVRSGVLLGHGVYGTPLVRDAVRQVLAVKDTVSEPITAIRAALLTSAAKRAPSAGALPGFVRARSPDAELQSLPRGAPITAASSPGRHEDSVRADLSPGGLVEGAEVIAAAESTSAAPLEPVRLSNGSLTELDRKQRYMPPLTLDRLVDIATENDLHVFSTHGVMQLSMSQLYALRFLFALVAGSSGVRLKSERRPVLSQERSALLLSEQRSALQRKTEHEAKDPGPHKVQPERLEFVTVWYRNVLTKEEFVVFMREHLASKCSEAMLGRLFDVMNLNADGMLGFDELVCGLGCLQCAGLRDRLQLWFSILECPPPEGKCQGPTASPYSAASINQDADRGSSATPGSGSCGDQASLAASGLHRGTSTLESTGTSKLEQCFVQVSEVLQLIRDADSVSEWPHLQTLRILRQQHLATWRERVLHRFQFQQLPSLLADTLEVTDTLSVFTRRKGTSEVGSPEPEPATSLGADAAIADPAALRGTGLWDDASFPHHTPAGLDQPALGASCPGGGLVNVDGEPDEVLRETLHVTWEDFAAELCAGVSAGGGTTITQLELATCIVREPGLLDVLTRSLLWGLFYPPDHTCATPATSTHESGRAAAQAAMLKDLIARRFALTSEDADERAEVAAMARGALAAAGAPRPISFPFTNALFARRAGAAAARTIKKREKISVSLFSTLQPKPLLQYWREVGAAQQQREPDAAQSLAAKQQEAGAKEASGEGRVEQTAPTVIGVPLFQVPALTVACVHAATQVSRAEWLARPVAKVKVPTSPSKRLKFAPMPTQRDMHVAGLDVADPSAETGEAHVDDLAPPLAQASVRVYAGSAASTPLVAFPKNWAGMETMVRSLPQEGPVPGVSKGMFQRLLATRFDGARGDALLLAPLWRAYAHDLALPGSSSLDMMALLANLNMVLHSVAPLDAVATLVFHLLEHRGSGKVWRQDLLRIAAQVFVCCVPSTERDAAQLLAQQQLEARRRTGRPRSSSAVSRSRQRGRRSSLLSAIKNRGEVVGDGESTTQRTADFALDPEDRRGELLRRAMASFPSFAEELVVLLHHPRLWSPSWRNEYRAAQEKAEQAARRCYLKYLSPAKLGPGDEAPASSPARGRAEGHTGFGGRRVTPRRGSFSVGRRLVRSRRRAHALAKRERVAHVGLAREPMPRSTEDPTAHVSGEWQANSVSERDRVEGKQSETEQTSSRFSDTLSGAALHAWGGAPQRLRSQEVHEAQARLKKSRIQKQHALTFATPKQVNTGEARAASAVLEQAQADGRHGLEASPPQQRGSHTGPQGAATVRIARRAPPGSFTKRQFLALCRFNPAIPLLLAVMLGVQPCQSAVEGEPKTPAWQKAQTRMISFEALSEPSKSKSGQRSEFDEDEPGIRPAARESTSSRQPLRSALSPHQRRVKRPAYSPQEAELIKDATSYAEQEARKLLSQDLLSAEQQNFKDTGRSEGGQSNGSQVAGDDPDLPDWIKRMQAHAEAAMLANDPKVAFLMQLQRRFRIASRSREMEAAAAPAGGSKNGETTRTDGTRSLRPGSEAWKRVSVAARVEPVNAAAQPASGAPSGLLGTALSMLRTPKLHLGNTAEVGDPSVASHRLQHFVDSLLGDQEQARSSPASPHLAEDGSPGDSVGNQPGRASEPLEAGDAGGCGETVGISHTDHVTWFVLAQRLALTRYRLLIDAREKKVTSLVQPRRQRAWEGYSIQRTADVAVQGEAMELSSQLGTLRNLLGLPPHTTLAELHRRLRAEAHLGELQLLQVQHDKAEARAQAMYSRLADAEAMAVSSMHKTHATSHRAGLAAEAARLRDGIWTQAATDLHMQMHKADSLAQSAGQDKAAVFAAGISANTFVPLPQARGSAAGRVKMKHTTAGKQGPSNSADATLRRARKGGVDVAERRQAPRPPTHDHSLKPTSLRARGRHASRGWSPVRPSTTQSGTVAGRARSTSVGLTERGVERELCTDVLREGVATAAQVGALELGTRLKGSSTSQRWTWQRRSNPSPRQPTRLQGTPYGRKLVGVATERSKGTSRPKSASLVR